ncbi:Protein kinase domain-containing protein [Mycena indigotica]|uniref:Protein kinase domain-containing protein n=1 Tax=Mycena indigotica TaxID=2126181 RepID=A0A8H6WBD4_9AGAR|nr:Protein kinase domain-containing protein [Mycena indigotica]KAF7312509.1 Protein kinase domain-containing protein [Mycena indigotica]
MLQAIVFGLSFILTMCQVPITRIISKEQHMRLHHTKNHCIPIFDVLQDPYDDDKQIIVMPQLIDVEEPIFQTVGEVIDFFRQVFEGIQFMHENFVAHRDCWGPNIAQDPTLLFPFGVHPVYTFRDPTNRHSAYYITRTECWPRYFLLDFGLSRRYDPSHGPPFEPVIRGGDQSPPEHRKLPLFCNPFPTDIYFLGNVLKENFLFSRWVNGKRVRMSSLRFLEPLTIEMTQQDPALRPTIGEVIERFDKLCTPLTEWHLRRPGQKTIRRIPPIPPYHPRTDTTPLSPSLREFYTQIPASSVVQQEKIEAGPGLKADFTGSESKSIAVESDG